LPNLQVPCYLLRSSRTEAPSLHQRYPASAVLRASPPPHGARPVRHRHPVGRPRPRLGASRVACAFLVCMLPPLPRRSDWRYCIAHPSSHISLPRKGARVGLRIDLFEACSAFTRVAACTLARSPKRDPFTRRLQPFRYLHDCSGCFRLERLPGGTCTHWKAPPCQGAHPERPVDRLHLSPGSGRSMCDIVSSIRPARLPCVVDQQIDEVLREKRKCLTTAHAHSQLAK
jgi:hypothetical protein